MTLAFLGSGALLAGLVMAAFSALLSFWAGWSENRVMIQVGRRAFYATAAMIAFAAVLLESALLTHDFSLAYVTEHSDLSTPIALVAAGFYGGQEGSLLYWALILGLLGSASLLASSKLGLRLAAYAAGIMAAIMTFFLVVLVLVASPFDVLQITPPDGLGLNPVLRDGGMLIHPPVVLAGFASFAIPFSFAAAALLAGRSDAAWIAHTRRFALLAWGLQSTGLVLGMWWAYHVLGWGGYWGWDPVENVALMPWLATTAYLHSSQVQERRGRLPGWNFGLVILAFLLVVFGTFIVRSGIVPSVHSFAVSAIGPWFLGFLGACLLFSVGLLAFRAGGLQSRGAPAPAVSREGAFTLQNLLLIGVVAVVFWGTMLPLVSGMFGQERVVGASYYERAAGPLFAAILALMAAGPLIPWRHAGAPLWRSLRWPAAAFAAAVAGLLAAGVRSLPALLAIPLGVAVAITVLYEYARAVGRWRHAGGGWSRAVALVTRRRRRYGAYLAHLGLAVVVIGLAASHFGQQQKDVTLQPGQQVTVAGYTLSYTGSGQRQLADHSELVAAMKLGDQTLEPARATYAGLGGQSLTHVAIASSPIADVYVVL
ncbi:MAG TPA: cytochrome c-type biogenesis CcmF C-terminal domain-containing protein, partial [Candidatus Dormibacteraeota bacterium]|nr:cytochrome c-type biogenesis CcmF C-terminal domain-containing protein [Candidatus Dormibacteraeota bacterium]